MREIIKSIREGINWVKLSHASRQEVRQPTPEWTKVYSNDGRWINADVIMKEHGFIPDKQNRIGDSALGSVNINQINGLALDNVFLGWGEMSLLQQNCLVNNICTILSHYLTEKWVIFHSNDESKKDKIIQLEKEIVRFKIKELATEACYKTALLGTAYFSPKIKGDEEDLANPLAFDSTKMGIGDLENIFMIEPTWVVPVEFNMSQPRKANYYKPEAYICFGEKIHASRMQQLLFIAPVNLISPIYLFGGIPVIQQLLPYILDFINTKKEIVQVVSRFNLNMVGTNMNALADKQQLKARMDTLVQCRNNWSVFAYDKNTEEFTQMQINVAGLTDILQQQGELLSLFSRIPVTYLFGQSPKGLNSTGQLDMQVFNEMILSLQEAKLRPILTYLFNLLQLNIFGEIDNDISFEFAPLGSIDEATQSQINSTKINDAVNLTNAGMADPQAMMDLLKSDANLGLSSYEASETIIEPDEDYE